MDITNILISLLILLSFCILMLIKYGFSRIRELEKRYEHLHCDSQRTKRTVRKIING
jgi:hypothetical protein